MDVRRGRVRSGSAGPATASMSVDTHGLAELWIGRPILTANSSFDTAGETLIQCPCCTRSIGSRQGAFWSPRGPVNESDERRRVGRAVEGRGRDVQHRVVLKQAG